jgi:methylase of polypeptide subunit release factors
MAYSTEDLRDLIIELDKKIDRVVSNMDYIRAKQDETNIDLARIKDPDNGLFSRVKTLENWKDMHSKITIGAITTLSALAIKQLWDLIT